MNLNEIWNHVVSWFETWIQPHWYWYVGLLVLLLLVILIIILSNKDENYSSGKDRGKNIIFDFNHNNEFPQKTKIAMIKGDYGYSKEASMRKDRPRDYRRFHKGKSDELKKFINNSKI